MRSLALAALSVLSLSATALADCKEEIATLIDRSALAGPYRTTATVTANDRTATIVSTIVPPGDLHSRTTVGDRSREVLKIGERVWVNEGAGWKEAPPAVGARIAQMTAGMRTLAPNLINDAECPGSRVVDGKTYTVYTYKMDVPGGKASSSNTVFVDPESRLPSRLLVDGRAGTVKSRTEMSYVYDSSIRLEPPRLDAPAPKAEPDAPAAPSE